MIRLHVLPRQAYGRSRRPLVLGLATIAYAAALVAFSQSARAQSVDAWLNALGKPPTAAMDDGIQSRTARISHGFGQDKPTPSPVLPDDPTISGGGGCVASRSTAPSTTRSEGCESVLIQFDFNSDKLNPIGEENVDNLGKTFASPRMSGVRLRIVGHTDGKGSAQYNQDLSERRAETVKRRLVTNFRVDETLLETEGRGESQLKDPGHPFAAENRRVVVLPID